MKHEKAALTALAYIIGFTTSFIAFGLRSPEPLAQSNTAQVFRPEALVAGETTHVRVEVTEDGLFYVDENGEHVISAHATELTEPTKGYHSSVVTAQLSAGDRWVHYCVTETSASPVCTNYIYDTQLHITHPVTRDDEVVLSGITARGTSWNAEDKLTIEGFVSINQDMPWKLVNP